MCILSCEMFYCMISPTLDVLIKNDNNNNIGIHGHSLLVNKVQKCGFFFSFKVIFSISNTQELLDTRSQV